MTRYFRHLGLSIVSILVVVLMFSANWEAQTLTGEWRAYAWPNAWPTPVTSGPPGIRRSIKINPDNVRRLRIAWRQSAVPDEMREGGAASSSSALSQLHAPELPE